MVPPPPPPPPPGFTSVRLLACAYSRALHLWHVCTAGHAYAVEASARTYCLLLGDGGWVPDPRRDDGGARGRSGGGGEGDRGMHIRIGGGGGGEGAGTPLSERREALRRASLIVVPTSLGEGEIAGLLGPPLLAALDALVASMPPPAPLPAAAFGGALLGDRSALDRSAARRGGGGGEGDRGMHIRIGGGGGGGEGDASDASAFTGRRLALAALDTTATPVEPRAASSSTLAGCAFAFAFAERAPDGDMRFLHS